MEAKEPEIPLNRNVSQKTYILSKRLHFQQYSTEKWIEPSDISSRIQQFNFDVKKPYLLSWQQLKSHMEDPYPELLEKKHCFNTKVEHLRSQFRKGAKTKKFNIDALDMYQKMHDLLAADPDEYFNSNYNWYYSGGNLDVANFQNNSLVFYAGKGSNFCVLDISKPTDEWEINSKKKLYKSNDIIYEIKTNLKSKAVISGIRHKKEIKLYHIKNSPEISCEELYTEKSEIPFVSFCLNPHDLELVTLDAKHTAHVWKGYKPRSLKINTVDTNGENWGQISYFNENTVIYVNNLSYNMTDLRTKECNHSMLATEIYGNVTNKFKNLTTKSGKNYFYLSADNYVVQIDSRMNKILNKWTHLLNKPIYLSDLYCNEENLLCIATRTKKLLLGDTENIIYIPLLVPTLSQSLDESIACDPTINMPHLLRKRTQFSTTGLKFIKNKDKCLLLTVSSIGDLYLNEFHDTNEKIKVKKFKSFGQELLDNIEKTECLNFNDKVVIKDLNFLKDAPQNFEDHLEETRKNNIEKFKNQLKRRVAMCKTNLCVPWNLGYSLDTFEEIDASKNVEMWLSRMYEPDKEKESTELATYSKPSSSRISSENDKVDDNIVDTQESVFKIPSNIACKNVFNNRNVNYAPSNHSDEFF